MKPSWALSLFVITNLSLFAPTAWGKPGEDPREAKIQKVKELASQGAEFFRAEQYEEALSSFEAAYALDPVEGFLLNIGLCHLKLERPQRAAESFRTFLERAASENPLRPKVEKYLKEAETKMTELGIDPTPTTKEATSPALSGPEDPAGPVTEGGSSLPKALYGGAALLVAAGGVVGGIGFSSIVKARALEEEGQFDEMAEQFARGKKLGFAADALLAAGLISGVTGLLLSRRAKKTEKSEAVVSLSPGGAALLVRF